MAHREADVKEENQKRAAISDQLLNQRGIGTARQSLPAGFSVVVQHCNFHRFALYYSFGRCGRVFFPGFYRIGMTMDFDFSKALQVLVICFPVFAVIGLGMFFGSRGILDADRRRFINWLVYNFSLPALIFNEVAKQNFADFFNPALIVVPFGAMILVSGLYLIYARARGYEAGIAPGFIYGTFWANTAYIGFPLTVQSFDQQGLALAAIYNAALVPFFIFFGGYLIAQYGSAEQVKIGRKFKEAVLNPIVLAAIIGTVISFLAGFLPRHEGLLALPQWADGLLGMVSGSLKLVGSMGLPLALLSIGSSLRPSKMAGHWQPAILTTFGKMVIMPLLTLLFIEYLYPQTSTLVKGTAVLMSAMPVSVASYVVAHQARIGEEFASTLLIVSTIAGAITIPIWLYVVM